MMITQYSIAMPILLSIDSYSGPYTERRNFLRILWGVFRRILERPQVFGIFSLYTTYEKHVVHHF
jgi:hypothetical protein